MEGNAYSSLFNRRRHEPRRFRRGGCAALHENPAAAGHAGHDHGQPGSQPGRERVKKPHVEMLADATGIPVDRIAALQSYGNAVGRIEVSYEGGEGFQLAGTAWLVRSDLAVTSRHVALHSKSGFAAGVGRNPPLRTNIFGEEPTVEINFGTETIQVASVEWVETLDEDLISPDLAFLRLKEPAKAGPLHLNGLRENQSVAVIQYPVVTGPESGDRPLERPGEEHLAGGEVVAFDARLRILAHTAITHGGSSGSPVIDLDTLKVVGVHSGSKFGFLNCATLASVVRERLELLGFPPQSSGSLLAPGLVATGEDHDRGGQQGHQH